MPAVCSTCVSFLKAAGHNVPPAPHHHRADIGDDFLMASAKNKLWARGKTLGVHFSGGTPELTRKVAEAANEWTRYCDLHFDFSATDQAADIHVLFGTDGQNESKVGRDSLNENPSMNLSPDLADDNDIRRLALHEFGHAIGLIHEHQRPDRDAHMHFKDLPQTKADLMESESWSQTDADENMDKEGQDEVENLSVWDKKSIMMYSYEAENFTNPADATEENTVLSDIDKKWIARIYGPAKP